MQPDFRWIFDTVAPVYEQHITPVLGQLAADFVEWITPQSHETAVDLGTGTGIVARLLAPHVRTVVGLDFASMMVQIAHRLALAVPLPNLHFIQGDAHCLAIKPAIADLAVSSLGFNATDPRRVFAEAHRILRPGGRFCFQEWGGLHPLDNVVATALSSYALDDDDAPSDLLALRDFLDQDAPWYTQVQTVEDFDDLLSELGFVDIDAGEIAPITLSLTVHEFIAYKMAWTARAAELAVLDASTRADCLDTLRARLYQHVDASGYLAYNPRLFRVRAIRV